MRSRLLPRPRAALSTLLAAGVVGGLLAVTAGPAGAQPAPPERESTFEAFLATIDRIQAEAQAEPEPEPEKKNETSKKAKAALPCRDVGSGVVPELVAEIFRCRLRAAGYSEADVVRIAAEAVVVAHCESLWDAGAVVFDGRYLEARHPATGSFYSAAGVFQFIRKTADQWIEGGYAHVTDARRNIEAAARLYLHNRARGLGGWDDWACAAANDGFKRGSVLPGWPGGPPALPDWGHLY